MKMGRLKDFKWILRLVLISTLWSGSLSQRNKHTLSGFHHDDDHEDHFEDLPGSSLHHDSDAHLHPQGVCEPIKVGLCMGIGYNLTTMPNAIGHDSQADAEALLTTFQPLIQYGCSANLKLFLCSAHVPMCTDKIPQPIGPCRSLCESVKSRCEPVLKEFGFEWPESLECSKFHEENNHDNLCNPGPTQSHYGGAGSASSATPRRDPYHTSFPSGGYHQGSNSGVGGGRDRDRPVYGNGDNPRKESPSAPVIRGNGPYTPPTPRPNSFPNKGTPEGKCTGRKIWVKDSCYLKCSAASVDPASSSEDGKKTSLFHPSEKAFARNYALLWAILSLSAASIALTLSLCSPRFSVAERPILYLALCQVLYSVGVIIGSTSSVACFVDKISGSNLLASGGMMPSSCAFVFLLTYFFGTATTMWWVILSLTWLLSLNRSIASSLLQKESSLFHLMAWGISSVLTSTALVHKKVDADELTGICGVGFQDTEALSLYNLIPLSVSLSIGLLFLILGLIIRIFFPEWNLPVFKFQCCRRRKGPSSTQGRMVAGCEGSNNSAATTTASHQTGQTHTHLNQQNSFRGPQPHQHHHHGYSPVLVAPPPPLSHPPQSLSYHHHQYSNCQDHQRHHHPCTNNVNHPYTSSASNCMCSVSSGPCGGGGMGMGMMGMNNNNGHSSLLYSSGNSPASVVGVGGFQRLRALENTKAIWMRIGIFALVHSLPIACQMGTMWYEMSGRDDWEREKAQPNLQIFLLRLNMNLIAGLTTGVWVLSTYSWKSLLTFARKVCNCLQFPGTKKTKKSHLHEQKMPVPNSVVAPLLSNNVNVSVNLPPIPLPSGSSSSSNNHTSTMPILGSNNTFTSRGAIATHNIPSGGNLPRHHYNYPLPPIPPRNPDHIAIQQQHQLPRTDVWRRGETIV